VDIVKLGQIDPPEGLYMFETPAGPERFIGSRAIFDWSAASRLHSMIFPELMLDASTPVKPCIDLNLTVHNLQFYLD
jgi:hypothetical protein